MTTRIHLQYNLVRRSNTQSNGLIWIGYSFSILTCRQSCSAGKTNQESMLICSLIRHVGGPEKKKGGGGRWDLYTEISTVWQNFTDVVFNTLGTSVKIMPGTHTFCLFIFNRCVLLSVNISWCLKLEYCPFLFHNDFGL